MTDPVKVRFAPSPTGFLHIGGARTALFNYLYAKKHRGAFVLRVEDTDKERSTPEAVEAILDGMKWLGLDWDEGPFFQSQRTEEYTKRLKILEEKGWVYRCYCKPEELEERRQAQKAAGQPMKYDGRCRELIGKELDQPYTLRFKVPEGVTEIDDLLRGKVQFDHREIEDLVLARSDGSPTYNFVVVVDDSDMGITHVIRGDDHLNNTPKQVLLYKALGVPVPKFAHLPLILGQDKKRLSKRHGATSVQSYREMGFLSHAVVNFLARIGWSHGDQEVFSKEELIEKFDLDHVGSSAGVFNEEKLLWLNQHYIKESSDEFLLDGISKFLDVSPDRRKDPGCALLLRTLRDRSQTLKEMAEKSAFFFSESVSFDEKAVSKFFKADVLDPFRKLKQVFESLEDMSEDVVKPRFQELLSELDLKMGKLAQPLRVALVGGTTSPGIFEVIEMLGKERVLKRLETAIKMIES